jgi:hypothetical protein
MDDAHLEQLHVRLLHTHRSSIIALITAGGTDDRLTSDLARLRVRESPSPDSSPPRPVKRNRLQVRLAELYFSTSLLVHCTCLWKCKSLVSRALPCVHSASTQSECTAE